MKNIIFNKYSQELLDRGVENITIFPKHVMNIYFSKGFITLVSLMVLFVFLGIFRDSYFCLYSLPLIPLTTIYFSIYKFVLERDEIITTDTSLIIKTGVFFTDVAQYNFQTIESIQIKQSLLGSYLDYGDVYIHGNGGTITKLDRVESPYFIKVPHSRFLEPKPTKKIIPTPKSLKSELLKNLNQIN